LIDRTERLVLTNEHVANSRSKSVQVLFPEYRDGKLVTENKYYQALLEEKKAIKARVVWDDPTRDLALLQLDNLREDVTHLRVGVRRVRPGQQIHSVGGHPEGSGQGQWIYVSGKVRQVSREQWTYGDGFRRFAVLIASDMSINRGDSGGGVVNDRCELVGVNNMFHTATRGNTRHIDVTEVHEFLAKAYKILGKTWVPPAEDETAPTDDPRLARLLVDLGSHDKESRARAVRKLGDLGPNGRKAIPSLVRLAGDQGEPADLREAAVDSLLMIGGPGRAETQTVIEALQQKTAPSLRRYAASALGEVGARSPDAVAALVRALRDEDKEVLQNAAASLGRVGEPARGKALPELVRLLRDPEKAVRQVALRALGNFIDDLKPDQINGAEEMRTLADPKAPPEARIYACRVLSVLDENGSPAVANAAEAVSAVLQPDTEIYLAYWALKMLDQLKARPKDLGPALARTLNHRESVVRECATYALQRTGEFDAALMPAYLAALASPEKRTRQVAAEKVKAFGTFQKEPPTLKLTADSLESIKAALGGKDDQARSIAAYSLGTLGKDGAPVAAALRAALEKEDKSLVRLEMLVAFARMGPDALKALGDKGDALLNRLQEMALDTRADDPSRWQQTCTAITLVWLSPTSDQAKEALPVLARAMLLKNAPIPDNGTAPPPGIGQFPRPRFGYPPGLGQVAPARQAPDPIELELHERAKGALVKAGRPAAAALAKVFKNSFFGHVRDTADVQLDKRHARKAAFEVLRRIGPDAANLNDVAFILKQIDLYRKLNQEYPDVIAARDEAAAAIARKPPAKK
jgi:HEAT repeat protein